MSTFNYLDNIPAYIQDYEINGQGLYPFILNLNKYLRTGYDSIDTIVNNLTFSSAAGDLLRKIQNKIPTQVSYTNQTDAEARTAIKSNIISRSANSTIENLKSLIYTTFPNLYAAELNPSKFGEINIVDNAILKDNALAHTYTIQIKASKEDFSDADVIQLTQILPSILGVSVFNIEIQRPNTLVWESELSEQYWDSGIWN